MKKLILTLCLVFALLIAPTSSAYAESGMFYNNTPLKLVGVWIEVDGGESGWATLEKKDGECYEWSYDAQGKRWRPHIGIGGTPQIWQYNFRAPYWSKDDKTIQIKWSGFGYAKPDISIY